MKETGDDATIAKAQEAEASTCDTNMVVAEQIASMPATTLAGLRFKAQVSADQDHGDKDLIRSIMEDVVSLATVRDQTLLRT